MMSDAERNLEHPNHGEHARQDRRSVRRRTHLPHTPVTISLIVICALVFIAGHLQPQVAVEFMFFPPLAHAQPYRFITSAFLHGGFWHLVLNMYALWLMGRALEPALGVWRYLSIYFLSAVAGNVAVYQLAAMTGGWNIGAVGASGAIFGLFGALIVLSKRVKANMTGILVLLGINLVFGFVTPGISWESHIGGLLAGALLMWVWTMILDRTRDRRQRLLFEILATLGMVAVLVVLILV